VVRAPDCNWTPFPACGAAFFQNFGVSVVAATGFPAAPRTFNLAMYDLVNRTNIAGWANIRDWLNTFRTCAGGWQNFNLCLTVNSTMANMGVSHQLAVQWDVEIRTMEYQTGPAYNVIVQNWFCMMNVAEHLNDTIQQCADHFNQTQQADPSRFCQHLTTFLYCLERPYMRSCGADVGAVVCHSERIAYEVSHPECADHVRFNCPNAPTTPAPTTTKSSG